MKRLTLLAVCGIIFLLSPALTRASWESPGARYMHPAVIGTSGTTMIVFGGNTNVTNSNDTWLWNMSTSTWSEAHPAAAPVR